MLNNVNRISLSVIVPCYNMEHYLDRALASLSRQWNGRTDYEIILVNDASTDNTLNKLNDYKQRNPENVVVVDKKKNGGLGMARNSGLDVARGEWVVFFDPDDVLAINGYDSLLQLTEQKDFDILAFGVRDTDERAWSDDMIQSIDSISIDWLGTGQDYMLKFHYATSIKYFFKRALLGERRFRPLVFLEDLVFVLPVFLSDIIVAQSDTTVYYYIVRQSSLTNMIDAKKLGRGCDDILTAIQFMNQCKQGKSDAVQAKITDQQHFYVSNLFSRLLLCDKGIDEIMSIRQAVDKMSLLPFNGNGLKTKFYNFLFRHLNLMLLFRPVYRQIRKR